MKGYRNKPTGSDMGNQTAANVKKARTPALCPIADAMQSGWEDFRNAKPFPSDYETWGYARQRNYEGGRRLAAALSAFQTVKRWPRNRLLVSAVGRVDYSTLQTFNAENKFSVTNRA